MPKTLLLIISRSQGDAAPPPMSPHAPNAPPDWDADGGGNGHKELCYCSASHVRHVCTTVVQCQSRRSSRRRLSQQPHIDRILQPHEMPSVDAVPSSIQSVPQPGTHQQHPQQQQQHPVQYTQPAAVTQPILNAQTTPSYQTPVQASSTPNCTAPAIVE